MASVYSISFSWLLATSLGISACKREKPVVPDPVAPTQCWSKFVGTYIVYDTTFVNSWTMTIEQIVDTNSFGYLADFLVVTNFNNEFDFQTQFTCQYPYTSISLGIQYPAYTHSNNRYNLTILGDDTNTSHLENDLHNDTIVFYFRKENTLYWMADAVTYEDTYYKHIAVKQH